MEDEISVQEPEQQGALPPEATENEVDFHPLLRAYPDIAALPDEVAEAIALGEDPLTAYMRFENKELKAKLQAENKNAENKERFVGSLQGDGMSDGADGFLQEFLTNI